MRIANLIIWPALFAAGMAFGQAPPDAGFDCWVGAEGRPDYTHYIRCIADPDVPQSAATDARLDDAMALLHREIHGGSSATSERGEQGKRKKSGAKLNQAGLTRVRSRLPAAFSSNRLASSM